MPDDLPLCVGIASKIANDCRAGKCPAVIERASLRRRCVDVECPCLAPICNEFRQLSSTTNGNIVKSHYDIAGASPIGTIRARDDKALSQESAFGLVSFGGVDGNPGCGRN